MPRRGEKAKKLPIYPDSVKVRAFELFLEGKSEKQISIILTNELGTTVTVRAIHNWHYLEEWNARKREIYQKSLANVDEKKKVDLSQMSEQQATAYREVWEKAYRSLDDVEFNEPDEVVKAIDTGIKGERQVRMGVIAAKFVQDILDVLLEEIDDEVLLQRISNKLKKILIETSS